ncbi:FAS-associated factor 2 isoform X1 [Cimex lectularius]|uniref:UBX domain-containing protein n=1 Tax=Cimex lectularius TaxID=79782 RepID=A0A8I6RZK6_CIMLE|nr:FAS-associated factor 2 isoform X1 [Cimex lectularius]
MDDLELTPEQTEKVVQFQELTGLDNLSVCRDALHRHGWDLEVAVQDQLNISEGRPSVFATENAAPPSVVNDGVVQHVFYSPPSDSYRWGGPFGYIFSFVFQFCYDTITSILKFAFSIFWKEPRRQVTDPVGDVLKFIDHFNDTFSRTHPVFYQGSYSQALNDAKQELKFLVVYLHQDTNQDCINFCRDCLTDNSLIEYLNSRTLFWICNTVSGEGERVSHTLKASTYPFLSVIAYKESRMVMIARLEGPTNSAEVLSRLNAVISSNESFLDAARSDRLARSLNQRLRREQDAAYMESLRADQEKERKRIEEEEKRRAEEREEQELRMREQEKKEAIRRAKIDKLSEIPDEPAQNDPDALSVVFKMPSGERIERRFAKVNSLKDIYNFVFCHPSSPDVFEIATNFPKRTLQCDTEGHKTLLEAGLGGREVLFVYDLEA